MSGDMKHDPAWASEEEIQAEIAAEAEAEELEHLDQRPGQAYEGFFPGEAQLHELDGF